MSNTYDLQLVQGERFRRGFRYKVDGEAQILAEYTWQAQARAKELHSAALILDITIYLALDADQVTLGLDIPATVTFGLAKFPQAAAWDLFIWPVANPEDKILLVQGAATLDLATTDLS
jgi:hypothetical protein